MPFADSPMSANDDQRLYFSTISDLAYIDNGQDIGLTDYPNHFLIIFDLTSTQQTSHDFIHPELTIFSTSIDLKLLAASLNNIEIFIIGKKTSTTFVDSAHRVSKKSNLNQLMDEDDINELLQKCRKLN